MPCSSITNVESLWRLADFYDMPDLKERCQAALRQLLSPQNVLIELASQFARFYPVILTIFEEYALDNWVITCPFCSTLAAMLKYPHRAM